MESLEAEFRKCNLHPGKKKEGEMNERESSGT